MKKYLVSKTFTTSATVEIHAASEEEAIEFAKDLPDEDWEIDQFEVFQEPEYNAEEIDD